MPRIITDDELIVRTLKKGTINKKGELLYGAFRPSGGKAVVSAMHAGFGDDFCKAKSKEIAEDQYVGMAAIFAQEIRELQANVVDEPKDFDGHVHIDHIEPAALSSNPLGPELNKVLNDRCKALAKRARLYVDPSPDLVPWTGPKLA